MQLYPSWKLKFVTVKLHFRVRRATSNDCTAALAKKYKGGSNGRQQLNGQKGFRLPQRYSTASHTLLFESSMQNTGSELDTVIMLQSPEHSDTEGY